MQIPSLDLCREGSFPHLFPSGTCGVVGPGCGFAWFYGVAFLFQSMYSEASGALEHLEHIECNQNGAPGCAVGLCLWWGFTVAQPSSKRTLYQSSLSTFFPFYFLRVGGWRRNWWNRLSYDSVVNSAYGRLCLTLAWVSCPMSLLLPNTV